MYKVKNTTTPTATACTVGTTDPGYVAPQVGQTIALFDRANMRFVDKKILTVAVVSPGIWTLTFDTTNGASDTTFTPAVGDYVMPWSDSLPILIDPVAAFYETLGPGEQFATFFDEGYRQRRYPSSPTSWPNEITSRLSTPLEQLSAIDTVLVKSPALPYATPVGVVGVSSNLLEMGKLAVYPG